jgi:tRNA pseudouridine38-40 synthase
MRRFKLTLEYDGTAYHGWQVQPDLPTIQGALQDCLARLAKGPVVVRGAGRTDAGVHALGQVASFAADLRLAPEALCRALNGLLPRDIAVRHAIEAEAGFDAQFSARARTYRYTVLSRETRSALAARTSLFVPPPLELSAMQAAAAVLEGTHDFSAFRAGACAARSPVRTVHSSLWRQGGDFWQFEITADGFLQHMVRILVGTMLEIGRGRRDPAAMAAVLASRDRRRAGKTVPPHGLCLVQVHY